MNIIEIKHLSKTFKIKEKEKGFKGSLKSIFKPKYKIKKAVNNLSLTVEKGEVIAFIGPNGAGKSTTIKMLTGILTPSKGEAIATGNKSIRYSDKHEMFKSNHSGITEDEVYVPLVIVKK